MKIFRGRQFSFFGVSAIPFRMVFLMWLLFTVGYSENIDLAFLGVKPRTISSLPAILSAPLVHGGLMHLISNSLPLLFLGTSLFFFYEPLGRKIFWRCYFIPYILVWLLSPRPAYHLGASGLIYGLAFFLVVFGFLKRDIASILLSLVILFSYGGIFIYGLLPGLTGISWETHLAGSITGIWTAIEFHFLNSESFNSNGSVG